MPVRAGSAAALNQVTQGLATSTPSSAASFMHSRFWAAAVRKSAEELTDVCSCDCTKNVPSLAEDGLPAADTGCKVGHQSARVCLLGGMLLQ